MYSKLFTKILDSSIWLEPHPTRIVWLTLLAVMDEDGMCQFASVVNLARRAIVTTEEASAALMVLESPDPHSSDPENDGRRVERVPGGWIVLNATKYKSIVSGSESRRLARERAQRYRDKKKNVTKRDGEENVTPKRDEMAKDNGTVTQLEKEKEKEKDEEKPSTLALTSIEVHAGVLELAERDLIQKKITDPRNKPFREALRKYYEQSAKMAMTWGGSEGKHFSEFLAANPLLTFADFETILDHRARSAVTHSERPRKWLPNATSYLNGPLDRYNKPLGGSINGKPEQTLSSAQRLHEKISRDAMGQPDVSGGGIDETRTIVGRLHSGTPTTCPIQRTG